MSVETATTHLDRDGLGYLDVEPSVGDAQVVNPIGDALVESIYRIGVLGVEVELELGGHDQSGCARQLLVHCASMHAALCSGAGPRSIAVTHPKIPVLAVLTSASAFE